MKSFDSKLQTRIAQFVQEISDLVKEEALASVREALTSSSSSSSSPVTPQQRRGRPATTTTTRAVAVSSDSRAKRSGEQLEQIRQTVLNLVQSQPGLRMEQITAALGASRKDLNLPIRQLVLEKLLKTKGQKRATTYYPR